MLKDDYKIDPNIYKAYETEGKYGRYFAKMATIIPPLYTCFFAMLLC